MTRQEAEAELQQQVPGYAGIDYATQQALIDTRVRERTVTNPIAAYIHEGGELPVIERPPRPYRAILPPPNVPQQELRAQLRVRQKERAEAVQAAAQADLDVEESERLLREAQQAVGQFDDLDTRVAEADIERIKNRDDGLQTAAPEEEIAQRSRALEKADRARRALDHLVAERNELDEKAHLARLKLNAAAASVAVAEARDIVVRRLDEVEAEATALRVKLASLQLPADLRGVPADISRRAFAPLPQIKHAAAQTKLWSDFVARLRQDPRAWLDGGPPDPAPDDDPDDSEEAEAELAEPEE